MVLALGLIAVFAAAAYFLFAFERSDVCLAAMFFLTPFGLLSVDIGISFDAYKILGMVLWGALLARMAVSSAWPSGRALRFNGFLFCFLLWAFISTAINYPFLPRPESASQTFLRGPEGRPLVQTLSLWLNVSVYLLPMVVVDSWKKVRLCLVAFLAAAFVLSAYGVYQWFAMRAGYGVSPIAHRYMSEGWERSREGQFVQFGSLKLPRVHSLGGEPKGLGKTLALAVCLIFSVRSVRSSTFRGWLTSLPVLALNAAVLVLTFSTSGWITVGVGVPLALALMLRYGKDSLRFLGGLSSTGTIAVTVLLLVLSAGSAAGIIIRSRLIEREYFQDDPEQATLAYLKETPSHWITGAGAGGLSFYIRPYLKGWAARGRGSTLEPNSYPLGVLGAYGIPGLCLFSLFVWSELKSAIHMIRTSRNKESRVNLISLLALAAAVTILVTGAGAPEFWLVMGLLASGRTIVNSKEGRASERSASGYGARFPRGFRAGLDQ